ncbi:fimbrial protein [Comamonas thiooxydans]|uniref:fimbrial protein n=1 Tax=Comamonas thiooxydans TaxID=363952 RepID=UPI0009B82F5B|nr:fimbrial protein [Comamonas thiooxydans]
MAKSLKSLFRYKGSPKNLSRISFLLFSTLLSTAAMADFCYVSINNGERIEDSLRWELPSFKAADFDPNVPLGTVLYRANSNASGAGGKAICPFRIGLAVYAVPFPFGMGDWNTYKTPIEGIGIRVRGGINEREWWPQMKDFGDSTSLELLPAGNFTIELVKIGKITAGGRISGVIGETTFVDYNYIARRIYIQGDGIEVRPRVPSCALQTKTVSVELEGDISELTDKSAGPTKDFNLRLQCSGGDANTTTRMFIVFSDSTTPSNRSSTLSLSSDSEAKNVGIEILRENGELVRYGPESGAENQWMVGEFGNVPVDIKLRARYVGTSMSLKPTVGTANAFATFTISYK